MPRDEFGVPATIPPEISTRIRHTYYIPPQYYPFLKKLGDDTPELKPWMDKLMNGEMTFDDYEELPNAYSLREQVKTMRYMSVYVGIGVVSGCFRHLHLLEGNKESSQC